MSTVILEKAYPHQHEIAGVDSLPVFSSVISDMAPLVDGDVSVCATCLQYVPERDRRSAFLPLAERFGVFVDEIDREFARVINALPSPRYDTVLARRKLHCCKSDLWPCSRA